MINNGKNLPVCAADARDVGCKFYSTGKPCKHGHTSIRMTNTGVCMECKKIESLSDRNRQRRKDWREKNQDLYRQKKRNYYQKNILSERSRDSARYKKNRDRKISYQREYAEKNRDKLLLSKREYHKRKMMECSLYVISKRIRSLVFSSIKQKKSLKTERILGCTLNEFRHHIERQFNNGMSWDAMGKIHIDHIVPISSAKSEEDVIALNHHTNLMPVWASDNLSKAASREFLI